MGVFSLHSLCVLFGTTLSAAFSLYGSASYAVASLVGGGILTLCVFNIFPIRHFSFPDNERYSVGIKEVQITDENGDPLPLSIFYPIEKKNNGVGEKFLKGTPRYFLQKRKTISWVPFGDNRFLNGLARHASLPYILFSHLLLLKVVVPEENSVPPLVDKDGTVRSVILFTHGIAAFARLYTALLQQVASKGVIIFAVTHTDQSAAFCRDATNEWSVYMDCSLAFTSESRKHQLEIRSKQILFLLEKIRGGEDVFSCLGYSEEEVQQFTSKSPCIHLMGHSFGGSTVLSCIATTVMSSSPSVSPDIGVGKIVCLDPWFDPIEEAFSALLQDRIERFSPFSFPTLILLSEEWRRLINDSIIQALSECKNIFQIDIKTFRGTDHAYFCDVRVLSRVGKKDYCVVDPEKQVCEWGNLIASFIFS